MVIKPGLDEITVGSGTSLNQHVGILANAPRCYLIERLIGHFKFDIVEKSGDSVTVETGGGGDQVNQNWNHRIRHTIPAFQ